MDSHPPSVFFPIMRAQVQCVTCDVCGMEVSPSSMIKEVSAEVWRHDLFSFSLAPCADFHCEPVAEGPCYQAQCWWSGPLLRYPDWGKSYSRLKEKASWSAWDIFWEGKVWCKVVSDLVANQTIVYVLPRKEASVEPLVEGNQGRREVIYLWGCILSPAFWEGVDSRLRHLSFPVL